MMQNYTNWLKDRSKHRYNAKLGWQLGRGAGLPSVAY
jgi:hypothetical protein